MCLNTAASIEPTKETGAHKNHQNSSKRERDYPARKDEVSWCHCG